MEEKKIVRLFTINDNQNSVITPHIYNNLTNDWQLLQQFQCDLYFDECACYAINGDHFYVFDDGRRENSCSGNRINLRTGDSTPIEHPKLYYMELAVIDNQIYAFGFYGCNETERIVLRLSNENNRWAFVSRTKQFFWRRCCAVTSLGNSIFVAGGEDAWNKPCSLVERFDKSTRKWTKLPNMNRKRCYFILTIIDGQMYAIDRKITTAERYDFQRRLWVNITITGRKVKTYFSIVSVQDRLYAIERSNGQFYRIEVEACVNRLRLVCLSGTTPLASGQYELLSKQYL